MGADPGSFRALGDRLLRQSFPAMGDAAVERYLRRTEERIPRPTVLILDDEEDLRDIMRRMLERRGFRTLAAGRTDEALRICRDHPGVIDFLITDLGLPGVNGREFAGLVSSWQPHLRVVYVSGLPREVALSAALIADDDLFLKKPFSTESLVAALRQAISSPR